jgi:hypothetical protein
MGFHVAIRARGSKNENFRRCHDLVTWSARNQPFDILENMLAKKILS